MTPEDILAHAPRVLSQAQREAYFRDGFVVAEAAMPRVWVEKIVEASDAFVAHSRAVAASDEQFDLGPDHTPERPHVRRLKALVDRHPVFWACAADSPLADIAADLVGPDVKFHSSKLNYKHPGGGEVVKWHQDICSWPHTNYSPVTLGIHLGDVDDAAGPLLCLAGSHLGPLHVHRDADGAWIGAISDDDLESLDLDAATALTGPAGTVVAINCRTIHGSRGNRGNAVRALPLYVYSSADAFPWTAAPSPTSRTGEIVRGRAAAVAHLDPRPCPVPPDWTGERYGSIYTAQDAPPRRAAR